MASTKTDAWILDLFAGSSTTGIAANLLGRRFLGIEREERFAAISKARREEIENKKIYSEYRRKIPDIVKAEDSQLSCFVCCESINIESLPFLEEKSKTEAVLMYAIVNRAREKTELLGKIALGIEKIDLSSFMVEDIRYIMFHYWNNDQAAPYDLTAKPVIVNKQDIPSGFTIRMGKDSQRFLLLQYDTSKNSNIGNYNIKQVQRHGKKRYLPFITTIDELSIP